MKTFVVSLLMVFLVVARVPYRMALPSTVPAFLWSPHQTQYACFLFLHFTSDTCQKIADVL